MFFPEPTTKNWKYVGGITGIHGKTVGIIGMCGIGEETERIAKALGMNLPGIRKSAQLSF